LRRAWLALLACVACRSAPPPPPPLPPTTTTTTTQPKPARLSIADRIVVCGERFSIGAPVVLWTDAGGYDATRSQAFFSATSPDDAPSGLRYRPGRSLDEGERRAQGLEELRRRVDQFVIHYDVCGVSRRCFEVLHDRRGLSVHFLLDIDGTLYQTLDLRETAWHARQANARSIGIEIANIGAYPPGADSPLERWYLRDGRGLRIRLPPELGGGGVRTPDFVGYSRRSARVRGQIQGQELEMVDLTPEQYDSLERLAAGLCKIFPKIVPDAPRGPDGRVLDRVLTAAEFDAHEGFLGHYHVSRDKVDPGPAFDWERFLARVRARLGPD
jgi:N-acetyl-anhydromuramyl-L-alanine amidase AmpD